MSKIFNKYTYMYVGVACIVLTFTGCKTPSLVQKTENTTVPASYNTSQDTVNTAQVKWKDYFTDPHLASLIDDSFAKQSGTEYYFTGN